MGQWNFRGASAIFSWDFHGTKTLPWEFHGVSVTLPWDFHRATSTVGGPWFFRATFPYGIVMGFPWESHGASFHGVSMGHSWDFREIFIWLTPHGSFKLLSWGFRVGIGLRWESHGTSVVPCCYRGTSMGIRWDFTEIKTTECLKSNNIKLYWYETSVNIMCMVASSQAGFFLFKYIYASAVYGTKYQVYILFAVRTRGIKLILIRIRS